MNILVVSVSHQTAPMEVLAQVTLQPHEQTALVQALAASEYVHEALVLSTCNRTEVYAAVSRFHGGLAAVTGAFGAVISMTVDELQEACAVFYDEASVSHCFTMVSGLDSMVAGEQQILGQAKAALNHCQRAGTVGPVLNSLFQQALRVGKRVHSETAVGSAGRSLVGAALDQLRAHRADVTGKRVLVVGAGSMASLAAHTLATAGAHVVCVNRTLVKAERLAVAVGGEARPFEELDAALGEADVLVTCTGAKAMRITPAQLRTTKIQAVIDLALPADVDPAVAEQRLLINLESLVRGGFNRAGEAELASARELVLNEVRDFLGLRRAATVAPTVIALRTMASEVMAAELSRLETKLPELTDAQRAEIAQAVRRVVEKLLHQPTVRVKQLAALPDSPDYAAALRELFALDLNVVEAVSSAE